MTSLYMSLLKIKNETELLQRKYEDLCDLETLPYDKKNLSQQ